MEEQNKEECTLNIVEKSAKLLKLSIIGSLNVKTTGPIWNQCIQLQSQYQPEQLIIEASQMDYCDGAGIALLYELRRIQEKDNHEYQIIELKKQFQKWFDMMIKQSAEQAISALEPSLDWISNVGKWTYGKLIEFKEGIIFTGELTYFSIKTLRHPLKIRWRDTWHLIEIVGPNALPIVFLIGFLFGLIMAFQAAIQLRLFGADIYVANLVGVSLTRELGPIMTAIVLISRSSSAFAAELGTMKINQEIDALKTMGLEPMAFLVVPRLLAAVLMMPLLNIFMILFGLIGCWIVMETLGYSLPLYLSQLKESVWMQDFMGGMVKAFVFGIIVAAVGCMHGLRTRSGASAVGDSTTQSVVSGITILAFVDGIFSVVYYILDI